MSATRECVVTVELNRPNDAFYRLRYGYGIVHGDRTVDVPVSAIEDLLDLAETHYYLSPPDDPTERIPLLQECGRRLYTFLDTPERLLSGHRERTQGSWNTMVLSITAAGRLAHLPWELLHDGSQFLVAASRPVIPVRRVPGEGQPRSPAERALRLMFMACVPLGDELPELDYDAEHDAIMGVARRYPAEPYFDDSGDLSGLNDRLGEYDFDHFDVIHLSGHAGHSPRGAAFATEGPGGERVDADAKMLQKALRISGPSLLFLSGCRTAEASDALATVSLAEELVGKSAPVVLGWGRPVSDASATKAAAALYKVLAQGRTVAEALSATYLMMIDKNDSYWHTLRTFVCGALPGPLVSAARSGGGGYAAQLVAQPGDEARTTSWLGFVGRRRELQEAIRLLNKMADPDPVGLIICGMGGVGKSYLARRIHQRLSPDFDAVRILKGLTEVKLIEAIRQDPERALVLDEIPSDIPLTERLALFLRRYSESGRHKLLLFDLDEFEHAFRPDQGGVGTIEMVDGRPLTSPEAADTLTGLVTAIRTCGRGPHRIVMTSRYAPNLSCVQHFKVRYLRALGHTDVDRLLARLVDPTTDQTADDAGLGDVRDLAGGNPRLIEWLVDIANHEVRVNLDALRAALRDKRLDFLENNIFAPMLLGQLSAADRRLLEVAVPFDQSVPARVLARLGYADVGDTAQRARRLADLGLLEKVIGPDGGDWFAVPGVLRRQFMARDDHELTRTRHAACARELAAELGKFTDVDVRVLDRAVLREVHRLARLGGHMTLELDTAVALAGIELFWLRFSAAKEICEEMLVRREDHRLYLILAEALIELGRPCSTDTTSKSDLFFDRALDLCPPDAPADRAEILASRGFWANSYLPGPALPDLDEAIALARAHDLTLTLAFALRTKARALADENVSDKLNQIHDLLTEALELVDRMPHNQLSRAGVLLDRAIALHLSQDDVNTAYRDLAAALTIDNEVGTTAHQAITLLTMADATLTAGRPDLAEQWVEEATLRSTIKRVRVGAEITRGEIAWDRDDVDRARKHYEAGLRLARQVGSLRDQLGALSGLRRVYVHAADSAAVEQVRREQDEVVRQLRSPMSRIGVLIDSLAEERKTGTIDAPTAVERAREAATLASAAGRKDRELEAWQLFLDDAGAAGVPDAELEAPLRRLLVLLGSDDDSRAVRTAVRLGRLLLHAERFTEAQPPLEKALQHYERHGLRESSAELHERLSEVARGRLQPADAEEHLRAAACGRLEVGSYAAAVQSLRTLAAVQRDHSPALARDTLVLARQSARLAPSALDEEQVLIDLVALVDTATEPASSERPGDAEQPTEALRQQARSAQLRAQTLQVDVGSDLVRHVDPGQGGRFLTAVESLRAEVETEEGWMLPRLRVGADPELDRTEFIIRVWGKSIVRDAVEDSIFGDPVSTMVGRLRSVARTHQTQLQGPEPPPPFEADVDTLSVTDIIAALREQP